MERFKSQVKDWGLHRALYWHFMTVLIRLFGLRFYHVFVALGLPLKVSIPVAAGYEIRKVSPLELVPYADEVSEQGEELDSEFLRRSADEGDLCEASFFNNDLVGFDFSSTKQSPVSSQLELIVPTGFHYCYKSWTHPDHRRKKLASARIEAQAKDQWLMSIYHVETHNYPSLLKPYRNPSDRRIHMGYVGWFEIFGHQYPFASRRAKWIGFEFVRQGSPVRRLYTER